MSVGAVARGVRRARTAGWAWSRHALPALMVVYAMLGVLWTLVVPLGEGPDEPAHLHYALFLHQERRLPVQSDERATSDVPGEGHQPPLAYLLMQPWVGWLERDEPIEVEPWGNPKFRWNGGDQPNAYLHREHGSGVSSDIAAAWRLARLGSTILGAVTVLLTYATARRLWPETPLLALGAAALIGWNPQFLFHHALVSNDPLLITLASLLIFLSVVAAQGGRPSSPTPSPTRGEGTRLGLAHAWRSGLGGAGSLPLLAGVTLGLLLLTKQSALALIPVPVLALWLGRRSIRRWLINTGGMLIAALLVSGWWYARNWRVYGDPLGIEVFQLTFASGDFQFDSLQDWRDGGWNLLRSSVGAFGWLTLPMPNGAFTIVGLALLVALAGLLTSVGLGLWNGRGRAALVLSVALALMLAWTIAFAATAGTVAWQGRFIFPAAPSLGILLAAGLAYVFPRGAGLLAVALLWLLLGSALPFTLLRPAYTSPALSEAEAPKGSIYRRFDLGWKRGIELHDAQFPREARSGSTIPISFTWHAVERMDRSWTVFIHLVNDEERNVAKRNAEPLEGETPTNAWLPGDWFRDTHPLELTNTPPGTYRLRVGFYDPETHERLGVYDRSGAGVGDFVELGVIKVK